MPTCPPSQWRPPSTHQSYSHCVPATSCFLPSLRPPRCDRPALGADLTQHVPTLATALSTLGITSPRAHEAPWRPAFRGVSPGPAAALGSCQMSQRSNTRGSTTVDERAHDLVAREVPTIFLKFIILSFILFLPFLLGLFPRALLKINTAMNSGAIGILPSGGPRWQLGELPALGAAGSPHMWHLQAWPGPGLVRGPVASEAWVECATEGLDQGHMVL